MKQAFELSAAGRVALLGLALAAALLCGCNEDAQASQSGGEGGGGTGGGGGGGGGGPPPSVVQVAEVQRQAIGLRREIPGTLRAKRRSAVASVEPGRVLEVRFDEAAVVAEGDVLVVLDDRRLREDLSAAEAEVAVAQANVQRRRAELEQLRGEAEARQAAADRMAGSVSELTLRQAVTAAAVAEAEVNAAEKSLAAAETRVDRVRVQLSDAVVTAPFDGTIVQRQAEVGEYLQAGATVAILSSTGVFEAVIEVPEQLDFAALSNAAPGDVTIVVPAFELRLTPRSVRVVPELDARSRRFLLVADVESPEAGPALAAGMSVTASLPAAGEAQRLVVPVNAIQRDGAGEYVRMIVPGQFGPSAAPVGVEVLFRSGDLAVLADSPQLQRGASVVIEGGERLRPGQPVEARRKDEG